MKEDDTARPGTGSYFTPRGMLKILDPACGSGAFLSRVERNAVDSFVVNPPFDAASPGERPSRSGNPSPYNP